MFTVIFLELLHFKEQDILKKGFYPSQELLLPPFDGILSNTILISKDCSGPSTSTTVSSGKQVLDQEMLGNYCPINGSDS